MGWPIHGLPREEPGYKIPTPIQTLNSGLSLIFLCSRLGCVRRYLPPHGGGDARVLEQCHPWAGGCLLRGADGKRGAKHGGGREAVGVCESGVRLAGSVKTAGNGRGRVLLHKTGTEIKPNFISLFSSEVFFQYDTFSGRCFSVKSLCPRRQRMTVTLLFNLTLVSGSGMDLFLHHEGVHLVIKCHLNTLPINSSFFYSRASTPTTGPAPP